MWSNAIEQGLILLNTMGKYLVYSAIEQSLMLY